VDEEKEREKYFNIPAQKRCRENGISQKNEDLGKNIYISKTK